MHIVNETTLSVSLHKAELSRINNRNQGSRLFQFTKPVSQSATQLLPPEEERETMQNPLSLPPQLRFLNATATATSSPKDPKTTLYIIIAASLFSIVFFISISSSSSSTTISQSGLDPFLFPDTDPSSDPTHPSIAYLISGSAGHCGLIIRLLLASYHPRNHYLLHLNLSAPQSKRDALALIIQSLPIFKAAQNVNVIGKADFAYSKGSSTIPFTLHGTSILLRLSLDWDWFVKERNEEPEKSQEKRVESFLGGRGKFRKSAKRCG